MKTFFRCVLIAAGLASSTAAGDEHSVGGKSALERGSPAPSGGLPPAANVPEAEDGCVVKIEGAGSSFADEYCKPENTPIDDGTVATSNDGVEGQGTMDMMNSEAVQK
ncbi:hypothetical protein H9Q09_00995 [Aurantimonas sp. DM33-3]|nr:hypothetical protein [Aurantimonas sp. DM33-3]